ncbi:MAG: LamG domain-containing protein [Verrucomicrobiales bacterium]|nr:LamG domain-containing protein [Verrucomicrobiota bacterium JB025]
MKIQPIVMATVIGIASGNAQIVLNPGFEDNNDANWLRTSTDGAGLFINAMSTGFPNSDVRDYDGDDNEFSDLGTYYAVFNAIANGGRTLQATTDVFENDGTTPLIISENDMLGVTVALGNRNGTSNYRQPPQTTISIGYLTTAEDLTTFVTLDSTVVTEEVLEALDDQHFADFGLTTVVEAGSAAIGNQFAIQLDFESTDGVNRQGTLDNVRVIAGEADITSLTVSPEAVIGAEDVTLEWSSYGAGRIEITDDQGSDPIVFTATNDTQEFLDDGYVTIPGVAVETVFTLAATKAEDGTGTAGTAQVTVTVEQAVPDVTLVAVPSVATGTSDVTLYFNATVIESGGQEMVAGIIEGYGSYDGLEDNQVRDNDVTDFATILTGGPYLFEVTDGEIAGAQYAVTGFSGNILTVDGTPADDGELWEAYRIIETSTTRGTKTLTISDGTTTVFSTTDPSVIANGEVTISGVDADTSFTATASFAGGASMQDDASFSISGDGGSYEEVVLSQSPVGFYRFEESLNSTVVYDSSGNGAHSSTIDNSRFFTSGSAGIIGNGGTFDEPGSVGASVVTGVSLDPSASSWSITALVKPDEVVEDSFHIVSNRDGSGTGRSLLLIDGSTGILKSYAGGTNTPDILDRGVLEETAPYPDTAYCHVALTYDLPSTTLSVYLDGVLIGQRTDISPDKASGAWVIGAHKTNYGNQFWDGILDEVAFFDSALTQAEVTAQNEAFLSGTDLGILSFWTSDVTIPQGGSVDLFVKVGGQAGSATIDNGVGSVTTGASSTFTVSPTTTTTYTLEVDGVMQTVTVTVEGETTITITDCGFDDSGNYFIDVAEGVVGLKVTTSPDLDTPFTDATGVSNDGANRFTIAAGSLDSNADGRDFFRVETE